MNEMIMIGELSKKTGVSIPTIRYYISEGLIVPKTKNTKFYFNVWDYQNLLFIKRLRNYGFSIQEIKQVVSLRRISNLVEKDDLIDYVNILENKKADLVRLRAQTDERISMISDEIHSLNSQALFQTATGVPVRCLELLQCPHCHKPLQLNRAQMNYHYIMNSELSCSCGYQAEIKNGILYTPGGSISQYDKPDYRRTIYKTMPYKLVTQFQETYNWILPRLSEKSEARPIIMETHLNSFFFLYKHFSMLGKSPLYIISDKFKEIIEMYKSNLDRLGVDLDILYIVNNDLHFPLSPGSIDIFIDYNSSNEHNIFSETFLLEEIRPYLKDTGNVYSTYFSFDEGSRSLAALRRSYPENCPGNYRLPWFSKTVQKNYRIMEHEQIGVSIDSGEGLSFIFHQNGEKMYIDCFALSVC